MNDLLELMGDLLHNGEILIVVCLVVGGMSLRWLLDHWMPIDKVSPLIGLFIIALLVVGVVKLNSVLFIPTYQLWGATIAGFYMGILIFYGLWEDNFPPSPEVEEKVMQVHLRMLSEIKRQAVSQWLFNRTMALLGFLVMLPIWVVISLLIWIENPGPLFFVKNSVGRYGKNFKQLKFRTMKNDAERETGPVIAGVDDKRILKIGKVLRKSALDELPQLINILLGQMAIVGPRPQRTVLVSGILDIIPEFALRHQVLPGLSGLAQVAGSYYSTPRQKLRYDLLYIRKMCLGLDLKLLLIAFAVVFWLRWRHDWDGKVPRRWYYWFC